MLEKGGVSSFSSHQVLFRNNMIRSRPGSTTISDQENLRDPEVVRNRKPHFLTILD